MDKLYKLFTLKNIKAPNFLMTPLDLKEYINFEVKRVYFISSPVGNTGSHAHRQEEDELFIQVQGKCTITVDDGSGLSEVELVGPTSAIYVPHLVWHGFKDLSGDSIIMAISSTNYDPSRSDYCENYEEFRQLVGSRS